MRSEESRPSMKTAKEDVREILDRLPDDATLNDIQYHIYVRQKIEAGLKAEQEGALIPAAEVERRMERWLAK